MKHFGVMALELAKFAKINRVRSVTWIFFNGSSSNFAKYLGQDRQPARSHEAFWSYGLYL